ncbi:hypothetical protein [Paenibacillus radicis (ex Xue et al. 2023)]|uniref:Uncharacterized protein n=1 Tax=Paenibacillus radicis (ex Xue et al. 2023) TaxID=2972489 RepID=A0ABT1YIU7_9BACL|nr:hypothetical protein [Paenibacillus radicis (ex Xue et al. 2023)]MCR8633098.1 hypothetical protein [Paenibacillus radicis (ex Xue et al. 2023)]
MTLHEKLVIYAIVVLVIGFMLVLFMDVVRRGYEKVHSLDIETNPSLKNEKITILVEESQTRLQAQLTTQSQTQVQKVPDHDPTLVYPFYVDCSQDLVKNH